MNSPAIGAAFAAQGIPRKDSRISVSIVICTRNRASQLRQCLEAAIRLNPPANELLVVDNTTGDDATQEIARSFNARYTVEPVQGLSRSRNRGLLESRFEIAAFLDDDAIPDSNWLLHLLEPFADSSVAAVAGKVQTPESRDPSASTDLRRTLSRNDPHWFEIVSFGGFGLGGNMALRRSACSGKIFFDERLGRGAPFQIAEESYGFARLISEGYTAVYVPAAVVSHPSLRRSPIEREARNSVAYWLLLFTEFRGHRIELVRFLMRRLQRHPLTWPRDPQEPGDIINSSLGTKVRAAVTGLLLFLRTRKPKRD